MNHIYIPSQSPEDWRRLLAQPEKHWREGYSAMALAECWERADGFPAEFQALFATAADAALRAVELLLAIPEYKVSLPGGITITGLVSLLTNSPASTFGWTRTSRNTGMPGGSMAFDYGAQTIRFGIGVDEAEAKHLLERITARSPQYRSREAELFS